ncbi:unnamed protein product [Phaedon cochleariae]|uniref:Protein TsetseEP domain-containing protein n=1 Tax=Phaedon cochleariae TaxID=80249 RepID=A0A9P0GQP9_PHACE|nr:unnamed protein product [Phaedon cochleariae]
MAFKVSTLFVLVISALILEANSHSAETKSLGNEIDDLLHKLREAVDKAVVKAQSALDEATTKVNQTAQKVEDAAVQQMQSTEQKLTEELDKLKQKAKDAGVNIDECLGADEQRLISLPNVYSDDLVHCVEDQITSAIKYAQDGLNQIKTVVDDIENIKQEVKDCGHGLKAVKCLAKLAAKIEKDITTLPAKIEADAVATAALITQLVPNIEKCASDKTSALENEGEEILKKIGVCVATKIVT